MRPNVACIAVIILMLGAAGATWADGIIIPIHPHPPWPHPRPIPPEDRIPMPSVKYHRVNIAVTDQVAEVEVDQVFINEHHREIEGIYVFPIPRNAGIDRFSMWQDGKELKGKILDANEARKIYQDIVRSMRDPGLLEYMGQELFKASVFPIPARGEKRIVIKYTQLLSRDQDTVKLVYPLNTEKHSTRPLQEVTVNVSVKSRVPVENVYSPTHHISIKRDGEKKFSCGFEETDTKPDKDFVLYYTLSEDDLGLHLISYNDGADGYFMLLASPNPGATKRESMPKNVVFVLDSSGSMRGPKMDQAKGAAAFVLQGLDPRDRFNIIDFDNGVAWFREGLVPADKGNVEKAVSFVRDIEASGGTNINAALVGALKALPGGDTPGYLIFLTDGEPTVGVTEMSEILKNVHAANDMRSRVFVFGVGFDVNARLLDRIAAENRGAPQYVKPEEDIEVAVSSFYEKIASPVLSDVKISFEGVKIRDVYPAQMPDLFRGSQLVVVGRYSGSGRVKAVLTGSVGDQKRRFSAAGEFGRRETDNPFLPRIWATRRIAFLLEEIRLNGSHDELVDEIRDLGMRFGIVTPYTSFLVTETEKEQMVRRDSAGKSAAPMQEAFVGADVDALSSVHGRSAVTQSLRLKKARETSVDTRLRTSQVKYVKDRTFHLQDGVWMDSQYKEGMSVKTIRFGSQEYFELLDASPHIAPYFSVGDRCLVVAGKMAYRVEG